MKRQQAAEAIVDRMVNHHDVKEIELVGSDGRPTTPDPKILPSPAHVRKLLAQLMDGFQKTTTGTVHDIAAQLSHPSMMALYNVHQDLGPLEWAKEIYGYHKGAAHIESIPGEGSSPGPMPFAFRYEETAR